MQTNKEHTSDLGQTHTEGCRVTHVSGRPISLDYWITHHIVFDIYPSY